jgi:uncharacterized protein
MPASIVQQPPASGFREARPATGLKKIQLSIQVRPNASRNELLGWEGDRLVVRIQAPQREGFADKKLRRFLAVYLEVPLASVSLVAGHGTNPKIVEILNTAPSRCLGRLGIPEPDPPHTVS